MPAELPTTPVLHQDNAAGSPLTTAAGALIGAGQYLGTQGLAVPHDSQGWIQLLIGIAVAVLGAFLKQPGK